MGIRVVSRSFVCVVVLACAAVSIGQEHDHDAPDMPVVKPRVFLDKAPAIVAYQLRRLSDAELLLVDREPTDAKYIPVYEAILGRATIDANARVEALIALAKLRNESLLDTMLGIAAEIEDPNDALIPLLASEMHSLPKLADETDRLRGLLTSSDGVPRQLAMVGLLASNVPVGAWTPGDPAAVRDLLLAIPRVATQTQEADLRAIVVKAIEGGDSDITNSALRALAALAIEPADSFSHAVRAVTNPDTTPAAIELLLTLPDESMDASLALEATHTLVARIEGLPVAERTTPAAQQLVAATDKLLPRVEKNLARPIREKLGEITVRVVRIETVYEEMRYDTPYVVVEKGRKIRLELANPDAMPHNWNLCAPESIREVAKLAATLSGLLDEHGRQYVPDDDRVLVASPAAQAGDTVTVDFEAPAEPGEYPYVCTYPGHWMRMYGVLLVVDDIDAWNADPKPPADPLGSNRQLVQKWTMDDFDGDLAAALDAATPEIGKSLFAEATCASCHKVDCEGGAVGPDLTEVFTRWKGDDKGILREILEPSHKIEKEYEMKTVYTIRGRVITGIIVDENDEGISLVTNPDAPEPTKIAMDDIDEIETSDVSIMPKSLVDRFTRDEILEIVGYLKHVDQQAQANK